MAQNRQLDSFDLRVSVRLSPFNRKILYAIGTVMLAALITVTGLVVIPRGHASTTSAIALPARTLPTSVVVDGSGTMYVVTSGEKVLKLAPNGRLLATWIVCGGDYGVALDRQGNVYVAADTCVAELSPTGKALARWKGFFGDLVSVGPDGTVYAADLTNVHRLLPGGGQARTLVTYDQIDPHRVLDQSEFVNGLAVDGTGKVHVALHIYIGRFYDGVDIGQSPSNVSLIQTLSAKGKLLDEWGGEGSAPGEFSFGGNQVSMAFDRTGNLYVTDELNNRVQKLTSTGHPLAQWGGEYGSGQGQFNDVSGVALDRHGTLYVTDLFGNRIVKLPLAGR